MSKEGGENMSIGDLYNLATNIAQQLDQNCEKRWSGGVPTELRAQLLGMLVGLLGQAMEQRLHDQGGVRVAGAFLENLSRFSRPYLGPESLRSLDPQLLARRATQIFHIMGTKSHEFGALLSMKYKNFPEPKESPKELSHQVRFRECKDDRRIFNEVEPFLRPFKERNSLTGLKALALATLLQHDIACFSQRKPGEVARDSSVELRLPVCGEQGDLALRTIFIHVKYLSRAIGLYREAILYWLRGHLLFQGYPSTDGEWDTMWPREQGRQNVNYAAFVGESASGKTEIMRITAENLRRLSNQACVDLTVDIPFDQESGQWGEEFIKLFNQLSTKSLRVDRLLCLFHPSPVMIDRVPGALTDRNDITDSLPVVPLQILHVLQFAGTVNDVVRLDLTQAKGFNLDQQSRLSRFFGRTTEQLPVLGNEHHMQCLQFVESLSVQSLLAIVFSAMFEVPFVRYVNIDDAIIEFKKLSRSDKQFMLIMQNLLSRANAALIHFSSGLRPPFGLDTFDTFVGQLVESTPYFQKERGYEFGSYPSYVFPPIVLAEMRGAVIDRLGENAVRGIDELIANSLSPRHPYLNTTLLSLLLEHYTKCLIAACVQGR